MEANCGIKHSRNRVVSHGCNRTGRCGHTGITLVRECISGSFSSCQLSRLRSGSNCPQPHQARNNRPCSSVVDFCNFPETQSPPYLFTNLNVFLRRPGLACITGQEPLGVLVFVLELECARRALHSADRLRVPIEAVRLKNFARLWVHAIQKLSYDRQCLLNLHAFCPRAR